MNTVIYTAVFGGKETLRVPNVETEVKYICFSDRPIDVKIWDVIVVKDPTHVDPCRAAKIYKILPHLIPELALYDRSIWVDGNLELIRHITGMFSRMESDLAFFKHKYKHQVCIYREAVECVRYRKDSARTINTAVRRYRSEGHPEDWGLPQATVIFRNHTPEINQFNEAWWQEICSGTKRDQISLPVVLRRTGIKFDQLDNDLLYGNLKVRPKIRPLAKQHPHNW